MIQMRHRQRPFGGISQDIWYFSFIICMWTVVQPQLLSLAVKADTVKGMLCTITQPQPSMFHYCSIIHSFHYPYAQAYLPLSLAV